MNRRVLNRLHSTIFVDNKIGAAAIDDSGRYVLFLARQSEQRLAEKVIDSYLIQWYRALLWGACYTVGHDIDIDSFVLCRQDDGS